MPQPTDTAYTKALYDIQTILISTHPEATPGEKLVRVGWVIADLPADARNLIIGEAQRRCTAGWARGIKPTEFGRG